MLENMTTGEKALVGATAIGIAALVFHKPTRNAVGLSDGKRKGNAKATKVKFYKEDDDVVAVFPYDDARRGKVVMFDGEHNEVDSLYVRGLKPASSSESAGLKRHLENDYGYKLQEIKKINWTNAIKNK